MRYCERFTWCNRLGEHVLAHHDGAVSVMLLWDGIDTHMVSEADASAAWQPLYRFIDSLDPRVTAEFHLWREFDHSLARTYLDQTRHFVRGQDVCVPLREAMANHLAEQALSNRVAVTLTLPPVRRRFGWGVKTQLSRQAALADDLVGLAQAGLRHLKGGRLASGAEYAARIHQSLNRDEVSAGRTVQVDDRYALNEQLVMARPQAEGTRLALGDTVVKVLLLYLYPDAAPGLASRLATLNLPYHLTHIVRRLDRDKLLRASEQASNRTQGTMGRSGTESKTTKLRDEAEFRETLVEHGLSGFANAYIVTLYGDEVAVTEAAAIVSDAISAQGGQVRSSADVQLPFFRYAVPGQGYQCSWLREDHTWQVANMIPAQVFDEGSREPQMLRLGEGGQLVGYAYERDQVNHSFTAAMTGGGKGVNKVAQIIETYPLGIDWYIMEVGTSYQWCVEALGGEYIRIDPDVTVPNPLPAYAMAVPDGDGDRVLPTEVVTGTVEALLFILLPGGMPAEASHHYTVAAQDALQLIYLSHTGECADQQAPTLVDLHAALTNPMLADSPAQASAAKVMADSLESFLGTREGAIFTQPGNFTITEGITGVDLLLVRNKAKSLLKFYLVFLSLAFTQHAFARGRPSRVLLDEMHEYVKVAPDVIKPLCSGIARMGRKDGAALDLVSQELAEMDAIESAIINQCPWQTYLYRQAEWEAIAERVHMPAAVLDTWQQYGYPIGLPYRPAIQRVGDRYHDLHLTFPSELLDIASSSDTDLMLKETIGQQTDDVFERIRLLQAARATRGVAA